jgi:hypothetical protein
VDRSIRVVLFVVLKLSVTDVCNDSP